MCMPKCAELFDEVRVYDRKGVKMKVLSLRCVCSPTRRRLSSQSRECVLVPRLSARSWMFCFSKGLRNSLGVSGLLFGVHVRDRERRYSTPRRTVTAGFSWN